MRASNRVLLGIILVVALIGALSACTPGPITEPNPCDGTHPAAGRVYAPSTSWNLPADCFALRSDSSRWADNWFNNSNRAAFLGDPAARGHMSVGLDTYSTPVYDAADQTKRLRVITSMYGHNLGAEDTIPWNPTWEPSAGNDQEMIIVDRSTGREWGLWLVQKQNDSACQKPQNWMMGYTSGVDLCVGQAIIGRTPAGAISDFRKDSGISNTAARGLGAVNPLALLPTLDEIETGAIRHALNNEVYNPLFGRGCEQRELGTAADGRDCGYAIVPGSRYERLGGPEDCKADSMPNTVEARSKTVPEGMRFNLRITDDQIERWLDSRQFSGKKRSTARIFAVALRDYGWIVSDSTCWDSNISVEGVANPKARDRWRELGIVPSDGPGLLNGLIQVGMVETRQAPSAQIFTNLA